MEARLLFSRILQHWPELRLDEPGARWNGNPVYRGLTALPVATSLASRRI
jgi:cytochrome P450